MNIDRRLVWPWRFDSALGRRRTPGQGEQYRGGFG
jgi:hypothetical protein